MVWIQKPRGASWELRESVNTEHFKRNWKIGLESETFFFGEGRGGVGGEGMLFISSLKLSHNKVKPRLGENCVASFCQNILLLLDLRMLPIKYFFNPQGSTRIDFWIRLLTAQVLIKPQVNSSWQWAAFFCSVWIVLSLLVCQTKHIWCVFKVAHRRSIH